MKKMLALLLAWKETCIILRQKYERLKMAPMVIAVCS